MESKQFLKIGDKWINNRPGVITFVQQTKDMDDRACLQVFFVGQGYVRVYLSKPEGNDFMRWLNQNSEDLIGMQYLPDDYNPYLLTGDELKRTEAHFKSK